MMPNNYFIFVILVAMTYPPIHDQAVVPSLCLVISLLPQVLPPPPPHHHPSMTPPPSYQFLFFWATLLCYSNFCHSLRTSPFTCTLDMPSGLPWWDVFVPPSFLHGVLNLQGPQDLLAIFHSFRTTPFTSNPGTPPWLPQ